MANMLNIKSLLTNILTLMKEPTKAINFSFTPSPTTTGVKSYSFTVPSGYKLLLTRPVGVHVSGNATCSVSDRNCSISGTTVTVNCYLYNPNSVTGIAILGTVLLIKEGQGLIPNLTTNIDLIYPVGTFYYTYDPNFDPNVVWNGTWENVTKRLQTKTQSVNVAASAYANLCSVTIPANSKYLILAQVSGTTGIQQTHMCNIIFSGTTNTLTGYGRTTTTSGQGTLAWAIAITSSSSATVQLQTYGYAAFTATGRLVAIPLQNHVEDGYCWFRKA